MLSIRDLRRISSEHHRKVEKLSLDDPPPFTVVKQEVRLLQDVKSRSADELGGVTDGLPDYDEIMGRAVTNSQPEVDTGKGLPEFQPKMASALSDPSFLQNVLSTFEAVDNDGASSEEPDSLFEEVLLMYPVYSRYLRRLPMKDLLSLGQVSRSFYSLVDEEKDKPGRRQCEFIYRKNFIRHFNLSYGTAKFIPQGKIYNGLLKDLFIIPEHVIIFYSPDTFQYDVRYYDKNGNPQVGKFDELLNSVLNKGDDDELRVWHMRLFSVLQPFSHHAPYVEDSSRLSRNELNRMFLWHSEDLAMVILPPMPNVRVVHRYFNYSNSLFNVSAGRDRRNLYPLVALIEKKYSPKLLMMCVRDLPSSIEGMEYGYPILLFETQIFDRMAPEEWMVLSGAVSAYQVILDMSDSREERDEKIRALHFQVGKFQQGFVFYHTEMWPGGTSKEIPQCDMILLRKVFPGVPVLGGRAKKIMGNQYLPILDDGSPTSFNTLVSRATVTVVTAITFP
ncbi:hypothetical protein RvY_10071 [Ramazzottius varieornatus]|uniref:F-box domain-containing protein n=1 Tax=Ramazzottius varieornatus TaxID=947166 RepID=A0A1D1VBJ2_RAMVA|nr:hypothetical protein RvY_10071 [Ramazzottius varieornatus]